MQILFNMIMKKIVMSCYEFWLSLVSSSRQNISSGKSMVDYKTLYSKKGFLNALYNISSLFFLWASTGECCFFRV